MTQFKKPEPYGFALLSLLLLGLCALRIAGLWLSATNLYFDEAQYWAWAQEPAFGYFSKPPLIAWLIKGVTSVCGNGEFCVRLPSPLLHTATAFLIYALALRFYGARIAFWAAIVYATLPGISFSAAIMSTDALLLFFWTLALVALAAHLEAPRLVTGAWLGAAIGLGLNAKYAMIYFLLCAALYVAMTPAARRILKSPGTYLALALATLLILPNLLWNASHNFVTFSHVQAKAAWQGGLHPVKALEFFGSQFGIFGPVMFAALIAAVCGKWHSKQTQADRFLLFMSIPVLALICGQALLSRAEANWAATAFPAASILATALLLIYSQRLFDLSLALHLVAAAILIGGGAFAQTLHAPSGELAYKRMLGWREMCAQIKDYARKNGITRIATAERPMTAEALYYLRGSGLTILAAMQPGAPPTDHFEMTRPWVYDKRKSENLLLVSPEDPAKLGVPFNARKALYAAPLSGLPAGGLYMAIYKLPPQPEKETRKPSGQR